MSTEFLKHERQRLALLGVIGVPQSAQSTMCCAAGAWYSMMSISPKIRGYVGVDQVVCQTKERWWMVEL